ncbi:hypothetical protein [Streptomyces orinoci]|uniref:Secreted protein n=1 Tax=Streptomyces orinoci TaxID=67339 RepID=A0ABV3JS30_STRON|nr:hypothetical protein [Streptomyces orinoci]
MRAFRVLSHAVLAVTALLAAAVPASAKGEDGAPTEAGTTFRTATAVKQGQKATASASAGDYLYWQFPAGAGQRPTATATVNLADVSARHGAATWRLDVFDGLRRRQPCASGEPEKKAGQQDSSVTLTCTLRTVRPWAERWSDDPLPGAYYLRLTVADGPEEDLGLPVRAEVEATAGDAGGAHAGGGELGAPLHAGAVAEPKDGWTGGWWSDRWLWTGGGALLAALAGIGGYTLTRHPHRFRSRPGAG